MERGYSWEKLQNLINKDVPCWFLSFDKCIILKIEEIMRDLSEFCYLCNYSINLNLSQDIKVIFNEGDIKPFLDKHKAEIMCLQHYIQEKVFQSERK